MESNGRCRILASVRIFYGRCEGLYTLFAISFGHPFGFKTIIHVGPRGEDEGFREGGNWDGDFGRWVRGTV